MSQPDNPLETAIAQMVREMPDEQLLDLVRDRLGGEAPVKLKREPRKTKERRTPQAPKKARKKVPRLTMPKSLSENEQKALKMVARSRTQVTVKQVAAKLDISNSYAATVLMNLVKRGLIKQVSKTGPKGKRPRRFLFELK